MNSFMVSAITALARWLREDPRLLTESTAEPAVHVDDVRLGYAELLSDEFDLIGAHVTLLQHRNLALGLTQVKEQLLLFRTGAQLHQRPGAQNVFLDRSPDPPHCVGREPEALLGFEAVHRLNQADIALGNHLGDWRAVARIAHGDLDHEAQMDVR